MFSTLGVQTPSPQERKNAEGKVDKGKEKEKYIGRKRPREDQSPSMIDTSSKDFKIRYRKRARFYMEIDQGGELGQQKMVHIVDTPEPSLVGGQTMASPTSTATMYLQQ